MELLVNTSFIIVLVGLPIIFFISKPHCFASIIPLRVVSDFLVNVKSFHVFGFAVGLGDLLGVVVVALCITTIFLNIGRLFRNKYLLNIISVILMFLSFVLMSALFSEDLAYNLMGFVKISSWILLIPACALVFKDKNDIVLLRKYSIISLFLLLGHIIIANLFSLGHQAYAGKGGIAGAGLYMGLYYAESSLAMPLAMIIPYLFLPADRDGSFVDVMSIKRLFLFFIIFIILLLIMVRTSVLASVIGAVSFFFFTYQKDNRWNSIVLFFILMIGIVLVSQCYISLNKEQVEARFKDMEAVSQGNVNSLGSGRGYLIKYYMNQWQKRPMLSKVFGVKINFSDNLSRKIKVGTHNDFITLLLKTGIFGLVLYCLMLLSLFLKFYKMKRLNYDINIKVVMASALSSILIYSIYALHGSVYQILTMMLLAIMVGSSLGVACNYE